jgi:hypothetical protein
MLTLVRSGTARQLILVGRRSSRDRRSRAAKSHGRWSECRYRRRATTRRPQRHRRRRDRSRPRQPNPPISTLGYATTLSQGNRASASRGLGSIRMRPLQQQVLEDMVTKFGIERHQHKAPSVLKDRSGPTASYRQIVWMETLPGDRVAMTDQEYEPPISALD